MKLEIGSRVRVRLARPEEWAYGSAVCLNGMMGTVEKIKPDTDAWGRTRHPETPFLVRFDAPAPTWSTHQRPLAAFHFDAVDLVLEEKR
jgi:hypothetical protein